MSDAVDCAKRLASDGRNEEALRLLDQAGAANDPRALFERGVWHLTGVGGPRDLSAALAVFHRASAAGHVDGAMIAIAMTANGSGGHADWGAALALLEKAALTDPLAAHQLGLVGLMRLDRSGRPHQIPAPRQLAADPRILHFPKLLTQAECAHLAHSVNAILAPATVFDAASGRQITHPVRTSHAAPIGPVREDLVTRAINQRIAAITGTDVAQGEPLMILRYTAGQEYRLHNDALPDGRNQRTMTVLAYLNDGYEGGETVFPDLGLSIRGQAGDAILFDNVDATGRLLARSRHAGRPIAKGVKWLATRWIRAQPIDPWAMGGGE